MPLTRPRAPSLGNMGQRSSGLSQTLAPRIRSSAFFSSGAPSGTAISIGMPAALASAASARPVLPEEGSMRICPASMRVPRSIDRAARSLIEPKGLPPSSFR